MNDIGSYRPFILPSPRIYERMRARADEVRVEEALRQLRACLDAEIIGALAGQMTAYYNEIDPYQEGLLL